MVYFGSLGQCFTLLHLPYPTLKATNNNFVSKDAAAVAARHTVFFFAQLISRPLKPQRAVLVFLSMVIGFGWLLGWMGGCITIRGTEKKMSLQTTVGGADLTHP